MSNNFDAFEDLTFAENADPRAPMVMVLDCSDSMTQQREGDATNPMAALDGGLDVLVSELHRDPLAKRRVELSFVTYGSQVSAPTPFTTVDQLVLPSLSPMGLTSTGAALTEALDALEERKQTYKANGVRYYRPWCLLLSDGLATDDTAQVSQRLKEMEQRKGIAFFAVGIEGADLEMLSSLGTRQALKLSGLKFSEFFQWLSASAASVSASQPGDTVPLSAPVGWAEI